MAIKPDYMVGTISVAASGTAVTGIGTLWADADIQAGDTLKVKNLDAVILTVNSNTSITLAEPWTGGALTAATYRIRYQPDGSRLTSALRALVSLLGNGIIQSLSGLTGGSGDFAAFNGVGGMKTLSAQQVNDTIATPEYIGQVGTGCWVANAFSGTNNKQMSRTRHLARDKISSISVGFPAWYTSTTAEVALGGTITLTASVEYPVGVFTQLKWGGSASVVIADNTTSFTDYVALEIPDGAEFWIRTFYTSATGVIYVGGPQADDFACSWEGGSATTDKTMGGTVTDGAGSTPVAYMPVAIIGKTKRPTVAIIGDSRAAGGTDTQDATMDVGNLQRSVAPYFGVLNLARSSQAAVDFVASNARRRELAAYSSHIVVEYGINDMRLGVRTAAQVKSDVESIIAYFPTKKCFPCTVEPQTSSTDSWATLANQTPAPYESQRILYNQSVRVGLIGAAGYIDLADGSESSRNSGKWRVTGSTFGYTPDGLHANQAGNIFIRDSGVANPTRFRSAGAPAPGFSTPTDVYNGVATNLWLSPADTKRIVDSGSNADGSYVKFSDGTMICRSTGASLVTSIALGTLFRSSVPTFTFPIPFISTPQVSTGNTSTTGLCWTITQTISGVGIAFGLVSTTNTGAGLPNYIAVGRWK